MWRFAAVLLVVGVIGGPAAAKAQDAKPDATPDANGSGYIDGLLAWTEPLQNGVAAMRKTAAPVAVRTAGTIESLIGDAYYYGHLVPRDYAEAARWYRRAAANGNAMARVTLGDMYYYGRNLPQDYVAAVYWWQLAADQGVALAQLNLSVMYANGDGVTRDYVKAHMYANLAAARLPPGENHDIAIKNRDVIAHAMTRQQIAQAQQMARDWRPTTTR